MKKSSLLVICVLCLLPSTAGADDTAAAERAVALVLDSLHRAASQADGALYFSLFAEDALFLGTDITERWSVEEFRAFAEPYFSQGRGWTYDVKQRFVGTATDGATAWFDEVLWNDSYGTCRGTGVLVATPVGWRISQYSLSIPIPNELARDVVRSIRELDADADSAMVGEPLVVFLVRHAEKVDSSRDPELSAAGKRRAELLAETLRDAGISHVLSSNFIRTRGTAAPLAARLGLEVELYDPDDLEALVTQLEGLGGRHLVVGHSDTTPAAVELMGGDPHGEIDGWTEYDRLYILVKTADGTVSTVLNRFGSPIAGNNAD